MNRPSVFKQIKQLGKRFLNNINYGNLKKGLQITGNIIGSIEHLKGNPILGEKIIQLTNNNVYGNLKSGVESLEKLDKVYNHAKDLNINNIIPNKNIDYNKLNQEGVDYAIKARNREIKRSGLLNQRNWF